MEFYLETYALSRAKDNLVRNGADLPQIPSVGVVAGCPSYAPNSQGFGELVSEVAQYHQNQHLFLASKPFRWEETNWPSDLKDLNLSDQSVDWMIIHPSFFSRMNDSQVRDFSKESDRVLKEDGLIFAFHRTCLWRFKERMLRYLKEKVGLTHDYRRTYEQFRQLTHPLKSVIEADVSDRLSFGVQFALTVLAKQSNPLPAHLGGPYGFDLESYHRDSWK